MKTEPRFKLGHFLYPEEGDPSTPGVSFPVRLALFSLTYFLSALLSYELSHWSKVVSQFWLPSGLFLSALLLNPFGRWPLLILAAAVGDLAYNESSPSEAWPILVWFPAFVGNAASATLGAWLIKTFISRRPTIGTVRELVGLILLGGVVAMTASAFLGAFLIRYQLGSSHYWSNFTTWYSSDLLGVALFAPTVLAWRPTVFRSSSTILGVRKLEFLLMPLSIVALLGLAYYFQWLRRTDALYVVFPIVTWAALRLGLPGATLAILVAIITSDWFLARGYGPMVVNVVDEPRRIIEIVFSQVAFVFVGLLPATVFYSYRSARAREELRTRTMTLLATGAKLPQVLDSIVLGVQAEDPSMLCAIMLVDQTGKHLVVGSAPVFSDTFSQALNGVAIGRNIGACGHAAFLNQRVVTENIATDPNWDTFKEEAAREGVVSCWSQPFCDAAGHVIGTYSVYHRLPLLPTRQEIELITAACNMAAIAVERKHLEERLLRRQRLESIGRLAGGIAHDLNNLLTPITICASFLKEVPMTPADRELVDSVEASAKRGADLVKQVLTFARGVDGSKVALNLQLVVSEIESIVAKTFPKNIQFSQEIPGDLPLVLGDRTQLGQVLLNLCLNARDAMPGGGPIRIVGSRVDIDGDTAALYPGVQSGAFVEIEVSDSGVGMAPEVVDRIFEPFFTTKEAGRGTGLGLSTAMGIVRSHGGFVEVMSRVGQGSTFSICLPALAHAQKEDLPDGAATPIRRGQGETILLVDDEVNVLRTTTRLLEVYGYRVLTAANGEEGLRVFKANAAVVSVVITDVMMPVMDGNEFVRAIRQLRPSVPVVTVSGLKPESAQTIEGRWQHLSKPYTPEQMISAVGRMVTESRPAEGKGVPTAPAPL